MLKDKLNTLIQKQIDDKRQTGIQVCVYQYGTKVLSESYGTIDESSNIPLSSSNLFLSFSVTKGVVALLVHILVDKGFIEYDQYICHYWPNFKNNGKDKITIRQILSHQSGLHRMPYPFEEKHLLDEKFMLNYIENMIPAYDPGTKTGYCAITFNWIILGLLKYATKKPFYEIFDNFIVKPFDIQGEAFIGLPYNPTIIDKIIKINISIPPSDPTTEMYKSSPSELWELYNSDKVNYLCLPGINGYFTARSLAKIYGVLANDGIYGDKKIISDNCIHNMRKCQTDKMDVVLGIPVKKSMGFLIGPSPVLGCSSMTFGHGGIGGSIAFADPERRLGIAILVNKLNFDHKNDPVKEICDTIRKYVQYD